MKTLVLGCGPSKFPGAIGVDINPRSAADVICDLDKFPYPFGDNTFDLILCEHTLEHLDDVIKVMEEIHRIGKPNAQVVIRVPHYASTFAYRDPTHKHFFSIHSFDYFFSGTPVRRFLYTEVEFKLLQVEFPPPGNAGVLKMILYKSINRYIDFYEKYLAFIFPRHALQFRLAVVKG